MLLVVFCIQARLLTFNGMFLLAATRKAAFALELLLKMNKSTATPFAQKFGT